MGKRFQQPFAQKDDEIKKDLARITSNEPIFLMRSVLKAGDSIISKCVIGN